VITCLVKPKNAIASQRRSLRWCESPSYRGPQGRPGGETGSGYAWVPHSRYTGPAEGAPPTQAHAHALELGSFHFCPCSQSESADILGTQCATGSTQPSLVVYRHASSCKQSLLPRQTVGPAPPVPPVPPVPPAPPVPTAAVLPLEAAVVEAAPVSVTVSLPQPSASKKTAGRVCQMIVWSLIEKIDGGTTWDPAPGTGPNGEVDYDPTWPLCLSATDRGYNNVLPSMDYDPVQNRLVLAYSRSWADAGGSFVGTRIYTKTWPWGPSSEFRTWIPVCDPLICVPGIPVNCLVNGVAPVGEDYCHQFGPAVGVRSGGLTSRLAAVVWHDTRDSQPTLPHPAVGDSFTVHPLKSDIWGHAIRPGEPFDGPPNNPPPPTQSRITPFASNVPWPEMGLIGHPWWGDYQDGVMNLGSKFYVVWGDNRDGATEAKLWGASFNE